MALCTFMIHRFLMHQRPICVMSLAALCFYLRYLWKHRIRPEVLMDPPDNEDWVTLSSYDFEQQYITFMKKAWSMWINLRTENHMMVNIMNIKQLWNLFHKRLSPSPPIPVFFLHKRNFISWISVIPTFPTRSFKADAIFFCNVFSNFWHPV